MKKGTFLVMSSAVLLTGCVKAPQDDVKMYTASSAALIEQVDNLVAEYQQASFDRKLTMLANQVNGQNDTLLSSTNLADIEPQVMPANSPILLASRTIKVYSEALFSLASAETAIDTELASIELYRSLNQINLSAATLEQFEAQAPFSDDDIRLFSSLFSQLSHAYSETEKQQAIKQIVLEADPVVASLCDDMIMRIEQSNIAMALASSRAYVLAEEIRDFNQRVQIRSIALNKSRKEVEYLYRRWQESATTQMAVTQTLKALRSVKNNHHLLASELSKDIFASASLQQAINEMQSLKQGFETVEQLLATCQGDIVRKDNQLVCQS